MCDHTSIKALMKDMLKAKLADGKTVQKDELIRYMLRDAARRRASEGKTADAAFLERYKSFLVRIVDEVSLELEHEASAHAADLRRYVKERQERNRLS